MILSLIFWLIFLLLDDHQRLMNMQIKCRFYIDVIFNVYFEQSDQNHTAQVKLYRILYTFILLLLYSSVRSNASRLLAGCRVLPVVGGLEYYYIGSAAGGA